MEPLKNIYSRNFIEDLSIKIQEEYPEFKADKFQNKVFDSNWQRQELKDRMHHIAVCLNDSLPKSFSESIKILQAVYQNCRPGFELMIFPHYTELYGLDHWGVSMQSLETFTRRSSSEFAIRRFILMDPSRAMEQMNIWCTSSDVHLRRLSSEGCRPRLPWSVQLPIFIKDPQPVLNILENLKDDPEKYVQKSVANNLNDISKDHPELSLEVAERWKGSSIHSDWIIKHGMRTLLKKSETKALRLFGFMDPKGIELGKFKLSDKTITLGEDLSFSFFISVPKEAKLRLEYVIEFVKSNGKRNSKVFQIMEKRFSTGEHSIVRKQNMGHYSTRKIYPGTHKINIIINGHQMAGKEFQVIL